MKYGDPPRPRHRGAPMMYTSEMVATGRSLFYLNLYAEASLTNGFRYIKELLMQHHNFYLQQLLQAPDRQR
ncbi:MAG: hypothetical protein ACKPKO_28620, partial [Candidatus Fonsibacter sp.]